MLFTYTASLSYSNEQMCLCNIVYLKLSYREPFVTTVTASTIDDNFPNISSKLLKFHTLTYYIQKSTRQKKKRTTTIFPLRSPFNTKMLIVIKYSFLIKSY